MSLDDEEANETQQLMQNEIEEEEPKVSQAAASPVSSLKMSSGAGSYTSKTPGGGGGGQYNSAGNSIHESSKVSYLNEKRQQRESTRSTHETPSNAPKDTPDVKHMEKALLELLNDFHSGKLSAFGSGYSMEQMINIRDQQENLTKLHFHLCADAEKPLDDNFDNTVDKDKMTQLVHSLEQLSASIENLQTDISLNSEDAL